MSYDTMDHAGWVERNGAAAKLQRAKRRTDKEGRPVGWHAMPEKLNAFQSRVMDICGVAMGGIYNAPIVWDSVDWGGSTGGNSLFVPLDRRRELSTWDSSGLTTLVMLCHMARIRLSVEGGGIGRLVLSFWRRSHQGGSSESHPDLLERVREFYRRFPKDHAVRYLAERDDPVPARRHGFLTTLAGKGLETLEAEINRRFFEVSPAWMKPLEQKKFRLNGLDTLRRTLEMEKERAAETAEKLGTGAGFALRDAIVESRDQALAILQRHLASAKAAVDALQPAEVAR